MIESYHVTIFLRGFFCGVAAMVLIPLAWFGLAAILGRKAYDKEQCQMHGRSCRCPK